MKFNTQSKLQMNYSQFNTVSKASREMSFNATPKKKKWTKPIDNEKLQQLKCMHHFNKAMFTNKVKVYKRENIDIKNIQKTNTIFSDPSPLTKERFLNPNYKTPEVKPHEFSIKRT